MWSKGIWKSVAVVQVLSASISSMLPTVFYTGAAWPTSPLPDLTTPFRVNVLTRLWTPRGGVTGTLLVAGSWGANVTLPVTLAAGDNAIEVNLTATGVKLWWPRALGGQHLYNVSVTFVPGTRHAVEAPMVAPIRTSRRIGFRFAAMVTINDTNASAVAAARNSEGNPQHTLFLRVNGVAMGLYCVLHCTGAYCMCHTVGLVPHIVLLYA